MFFLLNFYRRFYMLINLLRHNWHRYDGKLAYPENPKKTLHINMFWIFSFVMKAKNLSFCLEAIRIIKKSNVYNDL